ncbi:proline-rich acidic protein 1 [Microtus oregoni]|uniref:proline-rich acidic protein 1 n=1 Tax=Microtus oregoni TaxID=111838 RepID=UPI001BB14833|nr:proline-rich acidic protein 1 [Microtus oregoni]
MGNKTLSSQGWEKKDRAPGDWDLQLLHSPRDSWHREGAPVMKRFLLATCLVAVLLQEAGAIPARQVPVKTKGKHVILEQETEKALGTKAMEALEKDNQLGALLLVPKQKLAAAEEKLADAMTLVETDLLSHLRNPLQGPEPDLDSLHHPKYEEVQDEAVPQMLLKIHRQVLQGPEKDLDHISHSLEDSSEP